MLILMMKKNKFTLVVLAALLLSTSIASANTIKLQTENFPPYNFSREGKNFAKDDGVTGISVDIVREMFERAQVPMTITLRFPWKRVYKMALEKDSYGVFSMVRSDERESSFRWVGPLAPDEWVLFAKMDSNLQIQSLQDAKQYKVGGYKGDALTDYLLENGLNVAAASQDKHNIKKLQNGTIDFWASNSYSAQVLAKQAGVSFGQFKPVYRVDMVDLYLGLNPSVPEAVVEKLQAALDAMRAEGRIEAITNKYIK